MATPQYSYNGWLASRNSADFGGIAPLVVAGESFMPGVRKGDVHTVLGYLAEQLHKRVEPIVKAGWHQADDWGYSFRPNVNNPRQLSCHSSGTAIDYNATRHPNGKRNTFTVQQVREIRSILVELEGAVRWGGDFTGTPDEMHFEIVANATKLATIARRIRGGTTDPNPPTVPIPTPTPKRQELAMTTPIDIQPGNGSRRLIIPTGAASIAYNRQRLWATVNGPSKGRIRLWCQSATKGINDSGGWHDIPFKDGISGVFMWEIPNGTVQVNVHWEFPNGGAFTIETLPK